MCSYFHNVKFCMPFVSPSLLPGPGVLRNYVTTASSARTARLKAGVESSVGNAAQEGIVLNASYSQISECLLLSPSLTFIFAGAK